MTAEESFTPLEQLIAQGEELGCSGEELKRFVEGQQAAERAERRTFELQQLEVAQKKVEAEVLLREKDVELERLKAEDGEGSASSGGSAEGDGRGGEGGG